VTQLALLSEPALSALPPVFADWFRARGWAPHPHQLAMLEAARDGASALLIAPTGGGKTLAGFLPSLVELAAAHEGLHTLYISPLKALAVDIAPQPRPSRSRRWGWRSLRDAHRRHPAIEAPAPAAHGLRTSS
jgi:replicative superfamily II helicase